MTDSPILGAQELLHRGHFRLQNMGSLEYGIFGIWDHIREKGPNTFFFKFQISKRHLGSLQFISCALKIGLSIMELQWSEFLIMCTFQL